VLEQEQARDGGGFVEDPPVSPNHGGKHMNLISRRIYDKDAGVLYAGRGAISIAAIEAISEGKAFADTEEGRVRLGTLSGSWMDEVTAIVGRAEAVGTVDEVVATTNLSDGDEVTLTITPRKSNESMSIDSIQRVMTTMHENACRGRPTLGDYEGSMRSGRELAEQLHGGAIPVNIIPSDDKSSCFEELWVFAGMIPTESHLRPTVVIVGERHPNEVEDDVRCNGNLWDTDLREFANDIVADNLRTAGESSCLESTWRRIHIWMPISSHESRREHVTNPRMLNSLDGFVERVRAVSDRTGREITVTVHWSDSVEEVFP